MSRTPSPETQLRAARSELKRYSDELYAVKRQLDEYRGRASKAEQEVSEWKARFDALLKIVPPNPQKARP